MAHHVRTPLMSATFANSALTQDCTKLIHMNEVTVEGAIVSRRMQASLVDLQTAFTSIEAAVSSIILEADNAHKGEFEGEKGPDDQSIRISLTKSCTLPGGNAVENGNGTHRSFTSAKVLHTASTATLDSPSTVAAPAFMTSAASVKAINARAPVQVLVVEDSVIIQKGMRRFLESAGCVVHVADNGKIGLKKLSTLPIDVVFVDFLMVCKLQYLFILVSYIVYV